MFLDTLAATQLLWSLSALAFTTKLPLGLALAVLALAVFAEAAAALTSDPLSPLAHVDAVNAVRARSGDS